MGTAGMRFFCCMLSTALVAGLAPSFAFAEDEMDSSAPSAVTAFALTVSAPDASDMDAQSSSDDVYNGSFTFSDDAIVESDGSAGFNISGTALTITSAGTYLLQGTCANGSVTVKKGTAGVTLVLADGFSLTNSDNTAPIMCNASTEVTICAQGSALLADAGSSGDAGIKAKNTSTLTITGSAGSKLSVRSAAKNGIKGAAGTAVVIGDSSNDSFSLDVSAPLKSGIASDGSVTINGGTVNVVAVDGIKSAPEASDTASTGNITINGGTIGIVASDDGIVAKPDWDTAASAGNMTAEGNVAVTGGVITVSAGADALKADYAGTGTAATNTVSISGGTFTVTDAGDEGIQARGALTIDGGKLDIASTGDGIKADDDIVINAGSITVASQGDAIQTFADLTVNGGTFNIKTKAGYTNSKYTGADSAKGLKATFDDTDTASTEATNVLTINGGTFTLNTADDAIHSDNNVDINGGVFSITTGDDAVHADTSLWLGEVDAANCKVQMDVDYCYEGLEGGNVYVYSGSYDIYGTDDGINAAGGSDASGNEPGGGGFNPGGGGRPGWPGGGFNPGGGAGGIGGTGSAGDYSINISGGLVCIGVKGDGIDSNGALRITGGTVVSFGGGGSENGLDADGVFTLTGGTVFASGSNNPSAATPASGGQAYRGWTRLASSIAKGATVNLTMGGTKVVSLPAPYAQAAGCYWFYSSPALTSASTISLSTGGAAASTPALWAAHSYSSAPTWVWASDYSSATAVFSCDACGEAVAVDAAITRSTIGAATVYTASVASDGITYTDTKTLGSDAHVHSYDVPIWGWASDYSSATATFTCSTCGAATTVRATVVSGSATTGTVKTTSYQATATGPNGIAYTDMKNKTETVSVPATKTSIANAVVTVADQTYAAKALTPVPVVKVGGTTLKAGSDYTVAYKNNTEVGTATVTITGKGSYTGTATGTFAIKHLVTTSKFSDLKAAAWYMKEQAGTGSFTAAGATRTLYLDYVVAKGILSGYTGTTRLGPAGTITRGQLATILYRAQTGATASSTNNNVSTKFKDVKKGKYYTAAVKWAAANGIVTGYTSGKNKGKFLPNSSVTRQELATMLYRYAVKFAGAKAASGNALTAYKDKNKVASWAKAGVGYLVSVKGMGTRSIALAPSGKATRAEAAQAIAVIRHDVMKV